MQNKTKTRHHSRIKIDNITPINPDQVHFPQKNPLKSPRKHIRIKIPHREQNRTTQSTRSPSIYSNTLFPGVISLLRLSVNLTCLAST